MLSRRLFLSFATAGVATLVLKPLAVLTTPESSRWLLYSFTATHDECCFSLTDVGGRPFIAAMSKAQLDFTPFHSKLCDFFGDFYDSEDHTQTSQWIARRGQEIVVEDIGPLASNLIPMDASDAKP